MNFMFDSISCFSLRYELLFLSHKNHKYFFCVIHAFVIYVIRTHNGIIRCYSNTVCFQKNVILSAKQKLTVINPVTVRRNYVINV